jgi:P4 family phage/plasmid primase-like protien
VDDAVAKIMEATERCAEPGWNMTAEKRAVRKMCTDWLRKHPRASGEASMEDHGDDEEEEQPKVRKKPSGKKRADVRGFGEDDGPENVVSLSQAREHRHDPDDEPDSAVAPAKKKKLKKGNEHCVLAPGILAAMADRGEHMLYTDGRMHLYRDGLWHIQSMDEEKAFIDYQVELGCRALNIPSTLRIASETRGALRREPTIHVATVDWDAHGKIPVKNGLVNPDTLDIEPYRPEHYATSAMDVLHDREAVAPRWIRMIEELLPDRETRDFLQECVGMAMVKTKARSLTRALILLGPSFSGKSNVLNIVSSLIAKEVNSTALEMLENSHGLVKFLQPHPWVLHEAFEQSRWEMSANVKALISGDPVTVNVKNGPLVTHRYRGAVLWATNVPPQFKESSRAIETRIAVVKFKKVFDPAVVTGLAREAQDEGYSSISEMILDTERSGLLNWALEGMRRAQDRGHFVFTRDMNTELEQIRNTSNPAVGFFADCVEFDKYRMLHIPDLYASFVAWWEENQGGTPPSTAVFGRNISAMADPRMMSIKYNSVRGYLGVKLSPEGLDFWNARANAASMERSTLRISGRLEEVNQDIPDRLKEREDVQAWVRQMWGEAPPVDRRVRPRRGD